MRALPDKCAPVNGVASRGAGVDRNLVIRDFADCVHHAGDFAGRPLDDELGETGRGIEVQAQGIDRALVDAARSRRGLC